MFTAMNSLGSEIVFDEKIMRDGGERPVLSSGNGTDRIESHSISSVMTVSFTNRNGLVVPTRQVVLKHSSTIEPHQKIVFWLKVVPNSENPKEPSLILEARISPIASDKEIRLEDEKNKLKPGAK